MTTNRDRVQNKVCIVGAGASGIAAAKVLYERGIPFDCFEKGSGIGGIWRYNNDNGMSSIYPSLRINTSKQTSCYSDFPMPKDYPDHPHHSQMLAYFESYIDRFGFRDKIAFQTEVTSISPVGDGTYNVTTNGMSGKRTSRYAAVLVANGHHWCPKMPNFSGEFWGQSLHSHAYKTSKGMEGKRVLVIGMGNSGCDIAGETARASEQTFLSTRHGAHIIPRYIFKRPADTYLASIIGLLPLWFLRPAGELLMLIARGSLSSYGLPEPQHRLFSEHPTLSSDLPNLVKEGKVKMKPNVRELAGDRVYFTDGSVEPIDIIIYATGYNIVFPFFDPSIINPKDNELLLYKNVVAPEHPNLYFIGLLQPWGPIMPLAELQSKWVADLLEGKAGLPSIEMMKCECLKEREHMNRRYVTSQRHTIQVDFAPYMMQVKRERKRGQKRFSKRVMSNK